jgi:predicted transcriptional regulator
MDGTIADAIDAELRRRGWSQTDAALELGVTPSAVNRWLLGSVPKPASYEALRVFLRVDEPTWANFLLTSLEVAHRRRGR